MFCLLSLFVFAIPEKFDGSYVSIYNALQEVEVADASIKTRPDFATFLENFGSLVRQHGLEDAVGLRLIHKHFPLEARTEGQQVVMSESFEMVEGVSSLVTQAREVTNVLRGSYPASWLFVDGEEQGIPFEFSNDPAITAARKKIDAADGFFMEVRQLIVERGFAHLLSLAILIRENLRTKTGEAYLERTDLTAAASIVSLCDLSLAKQNIKTSWSCKEPDQDGYCTGSYYCLAGGDCNGKATHSSYYKHEYTSTN